MSLLSKDSGLFTCAVKSKIRSGHLSAAKRRVMTIPEAVHAERVYIGLTSANLCMGGLTHPRDLRAITASRGGHLDQSLTNVQRRARGFHTSSPVPYDSTSYNVTDIPDFFVKYKQQRATSSEARGHEDAGLMHPLTHSILSGDVVASTRRLKAKIPVEHHATEGHVIHPSGFVVPGPGHTSTSDVARAKEKERNENIDRAIQTAAVAHRVLESRFEQVDATTLPSPHKVPFEVREPDGTVKHPSGFVPPTPAHKFRYTAGTNILWDRKASAARPRARQPSPARAVLRAVHTAVPKVACEDC